MNLTPHAAPRRTDANADRRRFWVPMGLAVVIVVALRGIQLPYPLNRDPGAFCMEGWMIAQGRIPYLDFWEHKNPGVPCFLAGVFLLFGRSVPAARILEAVLVLAACAGLWRVERRLGGGRCLGMSAPLLALLWSFDIDGGLYTSFWSSAFGILSVSAFLAAPANIGARRLACSLGAGLFLFLAFACRQTGLAILGVLVVIAFLNRRRGGIRPALASFGTFLVLVAAAGLLVWRAGFADVYWADTVQFNLQKNAWLANVDPQRTRTLAHLNAQWAAYRIPLALAALLLVPMTARPRFRAGLVVCLAWLFCSLVEAVSSRAGHWHYFLGVFPAAALTFGLGLTAALHPQLWLRGTGTYVVTTVLVIGAVAASLQWTPPPIRHGWAFLRGRVPRDYRDNTLYAAADALKQHTHPGEPVFVWSAVPTIQFLSGTLPVTRYHQNLPLLEASITTDEELSAILEKLRSDPPRICMVMEEGLNDFTSRGDAPPPALAAWIERHYTQVGDVIERPPAPFAWYNHLKVRLFRRNDRGAPRPTPRGVSQPAATNPSPP